MAFLAAILARTCTADALIGWNVLSVDCGRLLIAMNDLHDRRLWLEHAGVIRRSHARLVYQIVRNPPNKSAIFI
jgi:hypothetical protein